MSTLETIRAPLFVPADRPERFAKAATSGADAVILDLEDAVAEGAKETARSALRSDFTDKPVIVRVNAIGSAAFEADLAAVATLRPDAIMLPKAEDVHQIGALNDVLPCPVIALIESARGLAIARKIAATKGVVRLAFGSVDFCADLGCAHAREVLLAARFELVLASRLAGISAPLDGVTVLLDDLSATSEDAAHARDRDYRQALYSSQAGCARVARLCPKSIGHRLGAPRAGLGRRSGSGGWRDGGRTGPSSRPRDP